MRTYMVLVLALATAAGAADLIAPVPHACGTSHPLLPAAGRTSAAGDALLELYWDVVI